MSSSALVAPAWSSGRSRIMLGHAGRRAVSRPSDRSVHAAGTRARSGMPSMSRRRCRRSSTTRRSSSRLDELSCRRTPDLFALEKIGESIEGRSINHVASGTGPFVVLLWSQMHGDESTATSALFDLFEYLHGIVRIRRSRASCRGSRCIRSDAESGRRRAVPAPQRAEHRHQSRRAAAADARGQAR